MPMILILILFTVVYYRFDIVDLPKSKNINRRARRVWIIVFEIIESEFWKKVLKKKIQFKDYLPTISFFLRIIFSPRSNI